MAIQPAFCPTWSETPEDRFSCGTGHFMKMHDSEKCCIHQKFQTRFIFSDEADRISNSTQGRRTDLALGPHSFRSL